MQADDWSLVLFTLLMQTVVGALTTTVIVYSIISRKGEEETADRLCKRLLPWLGGLLLVAVTSSLTHLGSPLRAIYILGNLASSWLSREVLLVGLVTGCGALLGLLQWRSWGSRPLRSLLGWLTAGLGLALIFVMSQVYMLATVPPWDRLATPISFFSTSALLGVVTATTLLIGYQRSSGSSGVQRLLDRLPLLVLGLIGWRLVTILISALPVAGEPAGAPAIWGSIHQAGLFLIAAMAVVAARGRQAGQGLLMAVATLVVLGAELLGRTLFFASYWRIGI